MRQRCRVSRVADDDDDDDDDEADMHDVDDGIASMMAGNIACRWYSPAWFVPLCCEEIQWMLWLC